MNTHEYHNQILELAEKLHDLRDMVEDLLTYMPSSFEGSELEHTLSGLLTQMRRSDTYAALTKFVKDETQGSGNGSPTL